eukprot:scaffold12.g8114.t1
MAAEEDVGELRATIERLGEEIELLQRKLGRLHCTDVNALRRAYKSVSQHIDALEQESAGMVEALREFETAILPPELVAHELGVATAVGVGVAILSETARAVAPLKSAATIAKGLWVVGGAVVLLRLGAGALAHVGGLLVRNSKRKRRLLRKLEAVQEWVAILAALQTWAEGLVPPAGALEGGGAGGGEAQEADVEAGGQRPSPPESATTSEGELMEAPPPDPSAAVPPPHRLGTPPPLQQGQPPPQQPQPVVVDMAPLAAYAAYARLGERAQPR